MRLIGQIDPTRNLAVVAGAFNPPTIAHSTLAAAGRDFAGQSIFVLPERFPHKSYEGATLEDRLQLLVQVSPQVPVAVTSGGLFLDIARELKQELAIEGRIYFACGCDAAKRIIEWDYGDTLHIDSQLEEYELLVASREGVYSPPERLARRVHPLTLSDSLDDVSSTLVRERIAAGLEWEQLVPSRLVSAIRRIYGS